MLSLNLPSILMDAHLTGSSRVESEFRRHDSYLLVNCILPCYTASFFISRLVVAFCCTLPRVISLWNTPNSHNSSADIKNASNKDTTGTTTRH